MGLDKGIDPYSDQYLSSRINHLGNAVYIRLATPQDSWWTDPSIARGCMGWRVPKACPFRRLGPVIR